MLTVVVVEVLAATTAAVVVVEVLAQLAACRMLSQRLSKLSLTFTCSGNEWAGLGRYLSCQDVK